MNFAFGHGAIMLRGKSGTHAMYVYMLASHDEDGSINPRVTLDRAKLPLLLNRILDEYRANWEKRRADWRGPYPEEFRTDYDARLSVAMTLSDDELASHATGVNLGGDDFDGLHLYAIKVEEGL